MGTVTIDTKRYGRLLARAAPKVIETEREYERMLVETERLMDKGGRRNAEEDALLALLGELVGAYEDRHFPMADPSPREALLYLMEKRGVRQADLAPVFRSSGSVSEVVNGRRGISKAQAKGLAKYFGVSVELFI